jgi:hypothetical protein
VKNKKSDYKRGYIWAMVHKTRVGRVVVGWLMNQTPQWQKGFNDAVEKIWEKEGWKP